MKKIEKYGSLNFGSRIDLCKETAQELTDFSGISYECSEQLNNYIHKIGKVIKTKTTNDEIASLFNTYKCIPGIYLTTQECLKFAKKLKELTGRSHDCSGLV